MDMKTGFQQITVKTNDDEKTSLNKKQDSSGTLLYTWVLAMYRQRFKR